METKSTLRPRSTSRDPQCEKPGRGSPIMVKISVDGDDKAVGTKLFVTPSLWENGKAKASPPRQTEINGQLKEVSARLTHYCRITPGKDFVTAEKLRNAFLGVGVMENCILKDFRNRLRVRGDGRRAAGKSTYNKYLFTTISRPSFGRRRSAPT